MNKERKTVRKWVFRLSGEDAWPVEASPEEVRRGEAIADLGRRARFLRSRTLIRRVLGPMLELPPQAVPIEILPSGKPRLAGGGPPHFSISHSGDWLVVVVADGDVGVDVETRDPRIDPLRIARRYFSSADRRGLEDARDEAARRERFRRQWVAKEAAVKAAGVGLANVIERAECVYRGEEICGVRWEDRRFATRGFSLSDGTPGAVAVAGAAEIEIVDGEGLA